MIRLDGVELPDSFTVPVGDKVFICIPLQESAHECIVVPERYYEQPQPGDVIVTFPHGFRVNFKDDKFAAELSYTIWKWRSWATAGMHSPNLVVVQ